MAFLRLDKDDRDIFRTNADFEPHSVKRNIIGSKTE